MKEKQARVERKKRARTGEENTLANDLAMAQRFFFKIFAFNFAGIGTQGENRDFPRASV